MDRKNKLLFGFINRERPFTWILAIIIAMLVTPLIVTMTLYYYMR